MKFFKQHPLTLFMLVHFLVWSILPLLRSSLPMDSIEAIIWGQYCDLGTNKHPPLSGYLAYWFYTFGGHSHYAVYALSQLCVLLGFVYIYRLARCFLDKDKAALSVMLLEGVIYYGFSTAEFNVNLVSLALWPMTVYHFYRALHNGNTADWILTGLFAGLNLFNKYVSGFLLLAMLFFMVFDKDARRKFRTSGPYVTAIVCLFVVIPHLYWLYKYDFFVLDYFLGRSGQAGFEQMPVLRHIVYPLKFAGAQLLFGLGTLLVYFVSTRRETAVSSDLSAFQKNFLFCTGCLPLILMTAVSLLGGIKLKSMWGFPVLYMLPVLLWSFYPKPLTDKIKKNMTGGIYALMSLMAVAYIGVVIFNKSDKLHLDAPKYALDMERIWLERSNGRPFKYVAGDVWWTDNVALYAPAKPKPVIWGDPSRNPWFDRDDIATSGALIITAGQGEYTDIAAILKNVSKPQIMVLEIKNPAGKIKRKTIYYGFYNL